MVAYCILFSVIAPFRDDIHVFVAWSNSVIFIMPVNDVTISTFDQMPNPVIYEDTTEFVNCDRRVALPVYPVITYVGVAP
jgi:hypothetical protein